MGGSVREGGLLCSVPLPVGRDTHPRKASIGLIQGRDCMSMPSEAGEQELTLAARLGDCSLHCRPL